MKLLKHVTTREGQTFIDGVFVRYDILILEDELKVKFACRFYESEEVFNSGAKPLVLKDVPSNYISKLTKSDFKKMNSKTIAFKDYLEGEFITEIEKVTGKQTISNL